MSDGDLNTPFRIGTWFVQPSLNRLSDGDNVVTLEPRLMGVLVCLACRPGKIVSANDLLDTIWHGRAHADSTVYQAVADLRKVLGDAAHQPRYIETIAKKGYRLISPVTPLAADSEMPEIALHSSSGRQHRRRILAFAAGIASIAVAIILIAKPQIRNQPLQTNEGPRDRSVAVLPFVDMSQDGSQQYLGDGVSEELIHVLSNLPDLQVTARTSSFAFRDSNEDIRQIGNQLNVATILEGSVRKDGDRLRVTSQLVDTRNGYHLWSQTFDRHASDIFRIQNEIAVAVAKTFQYWQLDVLATDDLAAQADDLQAYELYLLGMHQLRKETRPGSVLAIEYFERAIETDPGFGRAYSGLSEGYVDLFWYDDDQESLKKAESAAEYALLLDGKSAEAFVALGRVKEATRDLSGAEVAYGKAIALNPNDVRAYMGLADHIRRQGRKEEALVMLKNALELNPMSAVLMSKMGGYYINLSPRDFDMAFEFFKRAMDLDPDLQSPYRNVGFYYYSTGQLDQAIPYIRKYVDLATSSDMSDLMRIFLISAYVNFGDYTSAAQMIRRAKEIEPDFGASNIEIHLLLARGDFSAARDIIHGLLPTYVDRDGETSLMAFYEMVIGDTDHAQEIYTRLAALRDFSPVFGYVSLYRDNELAWGIMGAVNLAHLHKSNGDTRAAQELLVKARAYIEFKIDEPPVSVSLYVLAQIASVEGNNDAAIEYFRKAVDAGWTKAWFGRIDPIMADLRKDARYMQMLEELEEKLLGMREHPKMLASNEP